MYRRTVPVLAAVSLVVAACGSSDGSSADGADESAFCDEIIEIQESAAGDDSGDMTDEEIAQLRSLSERAPDEIRDDMVVLVEAIEEVAGIDDDDPEGFEQVFEVLLSEEVTAAGEAIERFSVDTCGLEPTDADDAVQVTVGAETGSEAESGSELDDPLYDDFFDDPVDPDVASISGMKLYFDERYPDAAWRTELLSFGIAGTTFNTGGVDVTADAVEICEALLGYLADLEPDAAVEIENLDEEYSLLGVVATGTVGSGCTAS